VFLVLIDTPPQRGGGQIRFAADTSKAGPRQPNAARKLRARPRIARALSTPHCRKRAGGGKFGAHFAAGHLIAQTV
jgi:hypothetical protein